MKYYTGIGSRSTPPKFKNIMVLLAKKLASKGYILRSGGASGADLAFENGCDYNNGKKEIYLPWKEFNNSKSTLYFDNFDSVPNDVLTLAEKIYGPARWKKIKQSVKMLMARNMYQVLGQNLNTPSSFVICYTPDGCETHLDRKRTTGGTGQAISVASINDIHVINLYNEDTNELINYLLGENK